MTRRTTAAGHGRAHQQQVRLPGVPLTIDIPSYGTFTLGDEVQVARGFVLEHSSDDIEPGPFEVGGISVPAECAKHDIFLAH